MHPKWHNILVFTTDFLLSTHHPFFLSSQATHYFWKIMYLCVLSLIFAMADDFDPFDDIFGDEPVKNTRVIGKFRPKPKFQPQRKVSAKSSVASPQGVQTVHSAPHNSSESVQTAKSLKQSLNVLLNDNAKQAGQTIESAPSESSQPIKNAEQLEHGLDAVPNDKLDLHAVSVEENADALTGSEACIGFLLHTNTECTIPSSEEVSPNAPNTENIGGRVGTQVVSSIDDSTNTCKVADVTKDSDLAAEVDATAADEPIVSSADVHDDMDGRRVIEEMDVMDYINMTESTSESGQRTGKFQPKPNRKMQKNTFEASNSTSCSLGSQSGQLQPDSAENNFIPTSQNEYAAELSSLGFTPTLPTESTSELPLNEESINLTEVPQLDSRIHMEGLPEIPAKLASRRAKTGKTKLNAALDQQKTSTSSQENGAGRSLRPRKRDTSFSGLVDEERDETLASGEFSEERLFSSAIDEENINNEQPQVGSELQKKNSKRKSKKTENDKEKPPRKSKKAKEASEQETHAKKKKFSHSTRRRRILDKNLLNIPEEEFDPREVSFRDLILLAEHREKQMKTGQAAAGAPATHQSTGNLDYNKEAAGQYYNDPAGQYNNDEEEGPIAEDTTEYFNYQSRMEKIPRVRWTKQDTELFYEAMQQFGTDFSMIAQLFPGRSREQIRNKYKKEERQHPLRLREAVTNRSKDLSYFGKVIENLNKIRAEQEELEDYTSTEGGPDEGASNADDGGKQEHVEEEENGDTANDFAEVQSAAKPEAEKEEVVEDEEDETLLWSQYKSDM